MKSSFGRVFYAAALILLLALTMLGVSFQQLVKNYLTESTFSRLDQDAEVLSHLASSYAAGEDTSSQDFLLSLDVASRLTDTDIIICNAEGKVVLCSDSPFVCKHLKLQINSDYLEKVSSAGVDRTTGVIRGLYDDSRFLTAMPIQDETEGSLLGLVMVSVPTADTTAVLNKLANLYLNTAFVVVLLSALAALAYADRSSRPLREMAKAANDFGHGNLEARVRVEDSYSEETRDLAVAFNNMASSLQKSEYQRQEFVANVSHELKTPMTTISGYVDGILDGTIPPERQNHYLQIVSDETKRLSRLVRSMLDISQLQDEKGMPDEKKMNFDMEECAGLALVNFEKKINDKHINVQVDMPEHPVYTFANQDAVTQVVYNLVDNAVKFCPEGGTLGLTIKEGGGKAYVSVSNDGETIPPEELPLVFDRFHKLDKSRSKNRDGWGLGLYIVKTIVCSHGENISVTSRDGKTEFTFTMPLAN
ncbi:MAG: HAMP domain-containing histidine kinase [Clostridiales bacterium]|nr:HAMP domain-containing histidine kinase [Clostridiales bacterium]